MPTNRRRLAVGNCSHCACDETMTSLWRTGLNKERLCNACGLYVQTHGRMRPLAALGARKKAEAQAAKAKNERAAPDGKDDAVRRPSKADVRPRPANGSVASSVGSLPASQQPRGSRSNSVSTTTESSLPSPPNSTADLPSPPPRMLTDSPPPAIMSASLGRLDGAAMARAGLSADTDFASVRAKKGQKRHSISGGSTLGYPHQATNPNHVVLKAPTVKKKARFEQTLSRPAGHHSLSLSDLPRPLTALSASVPVSSPISIPAGAVAAAAAAAAAAGEDGGVHGLPCSKCAELLPFRSASVPMSEDPLCERCSASGGHHHHHHHHRHHTHQRAFSSSSVPVRSTMSSLALTSAPLEAWDSGDEDYEIVTRPSSPVQPQPRKLQGGWSLEEEFSFLDTVDSDEEAPPVQPTLAGWGGPFFRNMPMPPPKMPHAMAQQPPLQQQQQPQPQAPMGNGAGAYPSPLSSFLGYNNIHRSSTSSPSSASSHSPFPSNLPTPGETHPSAPGIHMGGSEYPPASPITDSFHGGSGSLSQRRGLGSAKLSLTSPSSHGFFPQGSGRMGKAGPPPPVSTLFHAAQAGGHHHNASNDLEFLVRGGPPSPIVFGGSQQHAASLAMRRNNSGTGASALGLGGATAMDAEHLLGGGADMPMTEEVEMEDLQ